MKPVRSLAIIGYGHVGRAFLSFFLQKGLEEIVLFTRKKVTFNSGELGTSVRVIHDLNNLHKVDLILVCVRDEEVGKVISELPVYIPIAYTSGSIQLNELSREHQLGVFYPLQSFAGIATEHVQQIPILIEAREVVMLEILRDFGTRHFNRIEEMSSAQRAKLHLAAVLVNNFTNHLFTLAHDWTTKHNLDFSLLIPLIQETVEKLNTHSPVDMQTGPASRGDYEVVNRHLEQLDGRTKELYKLFSESIAERIEKQNKK